MKGARPIETPAPITYSQATQRVRETIEGSARNPGYYNVHRIVDNAFDRTAEGYMIKAGHMKDFWATVHQCRQEAFPLRQPLLTELVDEHGTLTGIVEAVVYVLPAPGNTEPVESVFYRGTTQAPPVPTDDMVASDLTNRGWKVHTAENGDKYVTRL